MIFQVFSVILVFHWFFLEVFVAFFSFQKRQNFFQDGVQPVGGNAEGVSPNDFCGVTLHRSGDVNHHYPLIIPDHKAVFPGEWHCLDVPGS